MRRVFLVLTLCAGAAFFPAWAQLLSWQMIDSPDGRYRVEKPEPVGHQAANGRWPGVTRSMNSLRITS
jgi:hypothetical protein